MIVTSLIPLDEVVHFDICTHAPGTGAVSDADSTPTFSVFEEATDTPILSAQNFTKRTSLTGNYRGTFTASAANGFEAGKWYSVIASATVDSIAAKKNCGSFRVAPAENVAGVQVVDTTHISGDSTAADNLESAADGTGYNLGGGSVVAASVTGAVGSVTGAVGSVTGAVGSVTGNVGGNVTGSVGSVAAGGITASSLAADAITAAKLAADVSAEIADAVWEEALADHEGTVGSTAEALATAGGSGASAADIADAVWDEATAGHVTAGSFGKAAADILEDTGTTLQAEVDGIQADTEDIQARLPAALVSGRIDASVGAMAANVMTAAAAAADLTTELQSGLATAAALATVDTVVDAILVDTAEIGAAGAGLTAVPWNTSWDAEIESEVADALEATIADSIPADGTRPSVKQALYLLTQFMLERSVSGTTLTVRKADGSTSLFTLTLNDATSPTSITRAT
jgi:hypothetical protein